MKMQEPQALNRSSILAQLIDYFIINKKRNLLDDVYKAEISSIREYIQNISTL